VVKTPEIHGPSASRTGVTKKARDLETWIEGLHETIPVLSTIVCDMQTSGDGLREPSSIILMWYCTCVWEKEKARKRRGRMSAAHL
jgi:hypothetical protein